jgi:ribose 5-phosphate isomerase
VNVPEAPAEDVAHAQEKQQAADRAVEYVQSGMVVGLGAGSTALLAVRRMGHLLRQGRLRDIVDESKLSPVLGTHWPLPVEVIPFGWHSQRRFLEFLGAHVTLRQQHAGMPFKTDQGNLILDCAFGPIAHPAALAAQLDARTGIVEHGLFIGMATEVIVAAADGVRHLTPKRTI